jgi:sugar lactone lactonase YvrE
MSKPPIEPVVWQPPSAPGMSGPYSRNAVLAGADLLRVPGTGPEDIALDHDGRIVTGLDDGRICRLTPDGRTIEIVADTGGRPLGIEHRDDGKLVVCDAHRGLLLVDPATGDIEELVTSVDGAPIGLANNAAIHPDGSVLFSDSSRRFGLDHFKGDLIEHSTTGRLLRWRDGHVEVLLDGLAFANGVAITHDGDAVLVAETGAYRIVRLWLGGERAGQREVLVDNLPGFPDNLSTGPTGTVWVAMPSTRDATLDWLLPRAPALRKAVWALPEVLQPDGEKLAFVLGIDADGKVTHNLQGPGDHFRRVTGVRQYEGTLVMGSLLEGAVASISLPSL